MSLPGEKEHIEYLDYLERHSLGEFGDQPKMSKDEWRKMKMPDKKPMDSLMEGPDQRPHRVQY